MSFRNTARASTLSVLLLAGVYSTDVAGDDSSPTSRNTYHHSRVISDNSSGSNFSYESQHRARSGLLSRPVLSALAFGGLAFIGLGGMGYTILTEGNSLFSRNQR